MLPVALVDAQSIHLPPLLYHLPMGRQRSLLSIERPSLFNHGVSARLLWAWFDEGRFSSDAARGWRSTLRTVRAGVLMARR
jgi:hypothetical protein